MSSGYFVTGTDTGVGKTQVTAALIHLLRDRYEKVVGMKPVASGCANTGQGLCNADAEALIAASNVVADYQDINPYAFEPAIAPHIAAREAGVKIELERVLDHFERLQAQANCVVVEGVGGWLVPLGHVITTEHLAKSLDLPVVLVVGMRLGCLNHALLTSRAIESAGILLAGWIGNIIDPAMERVNDNLHTLEKRISAPHLGTIPRLENVSVEAVAQYLTLPV